MAGHTSAASVYLLVLCVILRWCDAQKCGRHAQHIGCGAFSGLLYSVNNQWPPVRIATENMTDFIPLSVPDGATLSVSLCNFRNFRVHDITIRNVTLVPPLVGRIGKNAVVRVHVYNTANLDVSGRLVIGYPMPEVSTDRAYGGEDTYIVSNLVRGPVADGASVVVDVSKSANVKLRTGTKDVWMSKSTLLNELINGAHEFNMHCFVGVCFEVRVWDSANVIAEERHGPNLIIQGGQLEDESVDTGCIGNNSFVRVVKRNIANVYGVRSLHIWDGELSDEAVDALNIEHATVEVLVENSANVEAHHVSIVESELIDEMVDARDITDSNVEVTCMNSANVHAESVDLLEGELIDESIDARDVLRANVLITLLNAGNVRVADMIAVAESELVDEVLDANAVHHGSVDISIRNSSNVLCGNGAISMEASELLENVIDAADFRDIKAAMFVSDSANVHIPADWLHMRESRLAAKPIDVDLVNGGIKLTTLRSMGNGCSHCNGFRDNCAIRGYFNGSASPTPLPRYHEDVNS